MRAAWPDVFPFNQPSLAGPHFYDLQVILWAADREAAGFNCFEHASDGSPFHYNYPKGWTLIRFLRIGLQDTRAVGLVLVALFFLGVAALPGLSNPAPALWVTLSLITQPVLSGLSWLNNDLVIFPVLVAAVWLVRRHPLAAGAMIVGAALLKLVPAATLPALWDGTRERRILAFAALGAVVLGFGFTFRDVAHAAASTPRPHARAFGHQVLAARALDSANRHPSVMQFYERYGGAAWWHRTLKNAAAFACFAVLVGATLAGLRRGGRLPEAAPIGSQVVNVAFRIGSLMYLGSFAVGHNWNHRAVFLLFAAPWLCATPTRRWIALLALAIMAGGGIPTGPIYLLTQLGTWLLAAALAYLLAADLSREVAALLPRRFSNRWLRIPVYG